jgi:CubicO group peptidase (beta-lactamase class C family)
MELFQRMPLLSRPGSRWRYSSPGYVLLGWIVQEASGEPYASFLAEHIFAPLGLGSTSAGDAPGGLGMARGYRSGQPVRSFDLGTASPGAGDVWSTADDLVRWDDALAAGELLTPGLRREMLTAHAPIPPGQVADPIWIASGYGYGWFVGTAAGRRSYFHPGDNPGYLAFNAWLPDHDIRRAVLDLQMGISRTAGSRRRRSPGVRGEQHAVQRGAQITMRASAISGSYAGPAVNQA